MKKIEEIDKNFAVKNISVKENTQIYDVRNKPFSIHGIIPPKNESEVFQRMPQEVADSINEGVSRLSRHCAGGRVRFKTNSSYIAIHAVMGEIGRMPHFALTGSAGFDLYSGQEHIATFMPQYDMTEKFSGEYNLEKELIEYTLNLPLYSEVKELYIILDEDAIVEEATPYKNDKPVVFYGSSITQGGCASRPGTAYTELLSRRLNLDYINLGFSGSARGEKEAAEYIKTLDMSVFVFDYDYNAPTPEHLYNTHERFFKIIREEHPDIPIICLTMPFERLDNNAERTNIIEKTYQNAKDKGDKNVYFINMADYLEKIGIKNECTVDRCHPNDLGFYFMAEAVEEELKKCMYKTAK